MLNIFGKDSWSRKITSLLDVKNIPYTQYDESDYASAPAKNEWVVALPSGDKRIDVYNQLLVGSKIHTLFAGCGILDDVNVGEGLVLGCCSLIRPGCNIGDMVYIGAGTIIDLDCKIGNGATIGDNVTICEGVTVGDNVIVPAGTLVKEDITL